MAAMWVGVSPSCASARMQVKHAKLGSLESSCMGRCGKGNLDGKFGKLESKLSRGVHKSHAFVSSLRRLTPSKVVCRRDWGVYGTGWG
jgi:hypothetical protein